MDRFERLATRKITVDVHDQVSSTNELMKDHLVAGQPTRPLVMVADAQTAGHGKVDRPFYSVRNCGAYFTVGLPMDSLPPDWQPQRITIQAVVAAYRAARQLFNCQLAIKWVNDLYRDQQKVAGILAETALDNHNQLQGIVVGWGINLTVPKEWPTALRQTAGALSDKPVSRGKRNQLVDAVVAEFLDLQTHPWTELLAVYSQHQYLSGKQVVITNGDQVVKGSFDKITDDGYLRIKTTAGPATLVTGTVRVI